MDDVIKKDLVLLITGILIVATLLFTTFLVLSDLAIVTGQDLKPQDNPDNLVAALEHYMNNENSMGMRRVFEHGKHSKIFEELFFGEEVSVDFGFSDKHDIRSKNQLSSEDLPGVRRGHMRNLTDEAGLTYLIIKVEKENATNPHLAPAVIIQKRSHGWIISELYDFMYSDSEILEVDDFRINYLTREFYVSLKNRYSYHSAESTRLYNLAQMTENITVAHHGEVLCVMDRNHIRGHGDGYERAIMDDFLYNPTRISIEDECDLGNIVKDDRNEKYLLEIVLNTARDTKNIFYYGNMII